MKKLFCAALVGILILSVALAVDAQGRLGARGEGYNYCPYCGSELGPGGGYGMGPGMMGGGYGMGPGMMGRGYGMGPGMMGGGYGMGPGMMGRGYGSAPGSAYGGSQECLKFFDETVTERKNLELKRFEYFEAMRNPATDAETVGKLAKEMHEIRQEIAKKAPAGCWGAPE